MRSSEFLLNFADADYDQMLSQVLFEIQSFLFRFFFPLGRRGPNTICSVSMLRSVLWIRDLVFSYFSPQAFGQFKKSSNKKSTIISTKDKCYNNLFSDAASVTV